MEVVLAEAGVISDPESNIFVTRWVFRISFELSDLAGPELIQEARVLAPEESNVFDFKQLHSPSLQSETECPTALFGYVSVGILHDSIEDDSTTQDFEPLVVVKDLQLE